MYSGSRDLEPRTASLWPVAENQSSRVRGISARQGTESIMLDVRFVIQLPASSALDKQRGLWDLVRCCYG